MEYAKQLITKAKGSRCKICQEYITEQEADTQEFQSTKTSRGGTSSYTPDVGVMIRKVVPMNNPTVTIFAENKILPTNKGHESFTFRPVLILDGTVTNMRKESTSWQNVQQRTHTGRVQANRK